MKAILGIIVVAAILWAVVAKSTFTSSTFESDSYDIRFRHISQTIALESSDSIRIVTASSSESGVSVKVYSNSSPSNTPLSFMVQRAIGNAILDEKTAVYSGIRGISFTWRGQKGQERAFAFETSGVVYVISTFGMPDDLTLKNFETIIKTVAFVE